MCLLCDCGGENVKTRSGEKILWSAGVSVWWCVCVLSLCVSGFVCDVKVLVMCVR